jgi:hypothetical protein
MEKNKNKCGVDEKNNDSSIKPSFVTDRYRKTTPTSLTMSSLHLFRLHATGMLPDYAKSLMQHFPTTYANPLTGKTVSASSSSSSGGSYAGAKATVVVRCSTSIIPRGAAFSVSAKDPQRLERLRADIRAKFGAAQPALCKNDIALLCRNDEPVKTNAQLDHVIFRQPGVQYGLYYNVIESPATTPIPAIAPHVDAVRASLASSVASLAAAAAASSSAAAAAADYKATICDAIAASVTVPAARIELRRAIGAVMQKHVPLLAQAGIKNAPREASLIAADLTHELVMKCSLHAVPQEQERKRAFVRKFTGESGAWGKIGAPLGGCCPKRENINASASAHYATQIAPQPNTVIATVSDMLQHTVDDPVRKLGYKPLASAAAAAAAATLPCKLCAVGAPCFQHQQSPPKNVASLLPVGAPAYSSDNDAEYAPFAESLVGNRMCKKCPLHPDGLHKTCPLCDSHRKHLDSELKGIACGTCGHRKSKHMDAALSSIGDRSAEKKVKKEKHHDKHHHHGTHVDVPKHDASAAVLHFGTALDSIGNHRDDELAQSACPTCKPGAPCPYHMDKHHHDDDHHVFATHEEHDAASDVLHFQAPIGKHCDGVKCVHCKPGHLCPLHMKKHKMHFFGADIATAADNTAATAAAAIANAQKTPAPVGYYIRRHGDHYYYYDEHGNIVGEAGSAATGIVSSAGAGATGIVSSAGAGATGIVYSAGQGAAGIVRAAVSPFVGKDIGDAAGAVHRSDCVKLKIMNIADHDADIIVDGVARQRIPARSEGKRIRVTPGHHSIKAVHGATNEEMVHVQTYNFVHCRTYRGTVSHLTTRIFMSADFAEAMHNMFGSTINVRAQVCDPSITASLLTGPGKTVPLGAAYVAVPLQTHNFELRQGERASVRKVDASKLVAGTNYTLAVDRDKKGAISWELRQEKPAYKPAADNDAIDLS